MISKKRCFALILAAIFLLSLCSCTSHEKDDLPEITIGYENYRPYIVPMRTETRPDSTSILPLRRADGLAIKQFSEK